MIEENFPEIEVHQLLHGYQEGHTLISSSFSISPNLRRTVAVLTDMSGPSMAKGFEEYITGFALAEEGFYSFSKTWYAPEMPRPGSVWTHTLLVSFGDLPKIQNVNDLLTLFQRPEIDKKSFKSPYSKPLKCDLKGRKRLNIDLINGENEIKTIIHHLYSYPEKAIIIKAKNALTFESLILEIWMQQWPKLKRNFSFCTGSIYPRSINNRYFDLQASPEKFDRNIEVKPDLLLLDSGNLYDHYVDEDWIIEAVRDLERPNELRLFFKLYGADINSTRSAFKKLGKVYSNLLSVSNKKSISDIVDLLLDNFPGHGEAEALKTDLLNNKTVIREFYLPVANEYQLLLKLSTIENYYAFNYDKLDFIKRFNSLVNHYPKDAINLLDELLQSDVNPYAEVLFEELALSLNEESFVNFFGLLNKKLIFILIEKNPRLINSSTIWVAFKNDHTELFTILLQLNDDVEVDWIKIFDLIVRTESTPPKQLSSKETMKLVYHLLDWSNHYNNSNIKYSWVHLFQSEPGITLSWLHENQSRSLNTIQMILANLNPNSKEVTKFTSQIWFDLLSQFRNSGNTKFDIQLATFCLAVAFNKPDKYVLELISKTFETVYYALKEDMVPYDMWRPIEIHTKRLAWLNDWDKCKKLIDALFQNFQNVRWSKPQINVIFYTDEVRERAWHRYKKKFEH